MENMSFQAEVKKWGQSLAIILPKREALKNGIVIGTKLEVDTKPAFKLSDIAGKLPNMERDTGMTMDEIFKQMKEDARSKWD